MQANKEQNYLSIVAVLNQDSSNLSDFIAMMGNFCHEKFNSYEFILVDNNAPKEIITDLLKRLTNSDLHANLITLPYEVNKEQAVLAGVAAAIGDYLFEFEDVVIDYSAADLWDMYQTCLAGNDIVLLRANYQTGFMARCFYKFLAKYSNKNSILYQSRIHLISRRAINRVNNINKVVHYRKYSYCNCGLAYEYVEYKSNNKPYRQSQLTLHKLDYAIDLLLIFTNLGNRISMAFSLLFVLLSILAVVYTAFAYVMVKVVPGWTTLMLLLSVSFTGIFLCFSIVIKYLNLLLANQQQDETLIASKSRI